MSNFGYPLAYSFHEESGDVFCPACTEEHQPTVYHNFYEAGKTVTKIVAERVEDEGYVNFAPVATKADNGSVVFAKVRVADYWDGTWVCVSCDVAESETLMFCNQCNKVLDTVMILHLDPDELASRGMGRCECEDCWPEAHKTEGVEA